MSLPDSRGRAPQQAQIAAFEQRVRSVVTDLKFLWYVSYFEQQAQQIIVGPVNIVMLLTDNFGGFGSIAKFNRDFMQALDACSVGRQAYPQLLYGRTRKLRWPQITKSGLNTRDKRSKARAPITSLPTPRGLAG
jgi:hypothetical protein